MIAKLTDPWFDAEFYGDACATSFRLMGPTLAGAQGLHLWCPCGYGKPQFPLHGGRPHGLIIPFANPIGAPPPPPEHGPRSSDPNNPRRPRWTMSGTGLGDLTLVPSVDVGTDHCWHGFLTNGVIS
jgi:hypothetical protein